MDALTYASFAGLIGERFEVALGPEGPGDVLTLAEATLSGGSRPDREAFSLIFHGSPSTVLPFETMTVFHPAIGAQAVFLGPIARDGEKTSYQAVFG